MKDENFLPTRKNKRYAEDIKYTIQFCDYVLLALGVWSFSKNNTKWFAPFLKVLIKLTCFGLLFFFVVPSILNWILIEKNIHTRLMTLPLIFYNFMAFVKYSGLVMQEKQIARCLRHVEEDWRDINNDGYRFIMRDSAKLGRQMLFICGALMYSSGGFNRVFLPLSRGTIVTPLNVTIRPLPCTGYYMLFDPQVSPNYEIVFFLQCAAGWITCSVTTVICGLTSLFAMHASGQLEILMVLMKRIVETVGIKEDETNKRIAVMVEHQIRVRSFLHLVESTMQQICLYEIGLCTIAICFFGYCLITNPNFKDMTRFMTQVIGITTLIVHSFMFCFVGEQLSLQSEKVALTSCVLEWYRLPDKTAKSVILIMAMSHCPTKMTAGNVVELSFQTFGQIIRTAAAYCNMMRTVIS